MLSHQLFSDFTVEVNVRQLSSLEKHIYNYGITFRFQTQGGKEDFYRFGISSAGEYALFKMQNDKVITLIDWTRSEAIKSQPTRNCLCPKKVMNRSVSSRTHRNRYAGLFAWPA